LRSLVNVREHRTQFFFEILCWPLEKAVPEEKGLKNGNRMRLVAIIYKISDFCVPSSMFEQKPYRNSFKSCHKLPDKIVAEKMSWKSERRMWYWRKLWRWPGIFHSFSCYYVSLRAESQIFASKCIFSSILILFTLIYP
jgi:hypothetical protein